MAYQWDSFREPRTPERDRALEREKQWHHQLQMTSPSIRRQREYNHRQPIPQPNFEEPSNAPAQGRIDWQQRFEQGFQSLSDCKIVGDTIWNQMKVYLQLLGLPYL